jgi:Queuine tRNA-ribosyltransferase
MRFVYADSLDYVDPGYDFLQDRNAPGRQAYWDDLYPHEILDQPPYAGILVSRGIVGDRGGGKYTETQAMRFRRVGARAFLRLDDARFQQLALFGDCGAFTYSKEQEPPYTPEDMLSFYEDGGFDYGCSVDHIIFDFEPILEGMDGGSKEARRRFEITLGNAETFLKASHGLGNRFTPLGVVQGWSPGSMAAAAERLVAMGYRYLAVGGTVPLKAAQIHQCLRAIRSAIPGDISLHILGFAKADEIHEFQHYGIESFDSASPMIRAFKDARSNYYLSASNGRILYYTAIRVPQADESPKLRHLIRRGSFRQEDLRALESETLTLLRAYDRREACLAEALEAVLNYAEPALFGELPEHGRRAKRADLAARYRRTLEDRPWEECACAICRTVGIEVILFRASNRNKRRGIHNLAVFHDRVQQLESRASANETDDEQAELFSDPRAAE